MRLAARGAAARLLLLAAALLPGFGWQPAGGQVPPPLPPPPPLPQAGPLTALDTCVATYGNTGCAARLFAEVLCDTIAQPRGLPQLEQQLQRQYDQAAIDFSGITPEQVEASAVYYYAPMLCPDRSSQIRKLFRPT